MVEFAVEWVLMTVRTAVLASVVWMSARALLADMIFCMDSHARDRAGDV